MNKNNLLKFVNILLFILFILQAGTGLGLKYIESELFEKIHYACGLGLILFVFIHLVLNWGWIKTIYFKRNR
ncbi:MAG: DUF4405 domain-containing protein [Candidatus Omnitrophota bacterium]